MTLGDVEKLGREGVHLGGEHAHLAREAVLHHDRRDGSREADGGRDQRLRDTGRHRLDARAGGDREAAERGHDTPHGAEEADERRRARGGGEGGEAALEARHLLRAGAYHGALHVLDAAELGRVLVPARVPALRLGEPLQLLVAAPEHLGHRALLQIDARGLDGREVLGVPEDLGEALRLPPCAAPQQPTEKATRIASTARTAGPAPTTISSTVSWCAGSGAPAWARMPPTSILPSST